MANETYQDLEGDYYHRIRSDTAETEMKLHYYNEGWNDALNALIAVMRDHKSSAWVYDINKLKKK